MLQLIALSTILYLFSSSSPFNTWLLGAIFLIVIGLHGLLSNLTVFIGFLWVIDFGVGLIFLIFMSTLTIIGDSKLNTFTQRSRKLVYVLVVWSFSIYLLHIMQFEDVRGEMFNQPINISWLNYYMLFFDYEISQLNLLREIFFYNNAWEFLLINYVVFFGLLGVIILNFYITEMHKYTSLNLLLNGGTSANSKAPLFIRDQNFIKQQQISSSVRLWGKVNRSNLSQ